MALLGLEWSINRENDAKDFDGVSGSPAPLINMKSTCAIHSAMLSCHRAKNDQKKHIHPQSHQYASSPPQLKEEQKKVYTYRSERATEGRSFAEVVTGLLVWSINWSRPDSCSIKPPDTNNTQRRRKTWSVNTSYWRLDSSFLFNDRKSFDKDIENKIMEERLTIGHGIVYRIGVVVSTLGHITTHFPGVISVITRKLCSGDGEMKD